MLCIDYGGTNFRYQLNNEAIITQSSHHTDLLAFLDTMIKQHGVEKIGISFAGQVSNGKILSAVNIDLKNLDLKKYIYEQYKVQLEIQNDLKCAALFESSLYPTAKSVAVVYIGTGVGCGLINQGELISGYNNFAGELGHIPYKRSAFVCGCGRDDCLELFVSGSALKRWSDHDGLSLANPTLDEISKHPLGKPIIKEFKQALQHLFFTLLNIYDAQVFVFGGSVMQKNPKLIKSLEKFYTQSAFYHVRKVPKIVLSSSMNGSLQGAKILLQHKGDNK
jgi:glucokinase